MSDTPRTDAFEQKVPYSRTDLLAFARKLERDLAWTREQNERHIAIAYEQRARAEKAEAARPEVGAPVLSGCAVRAAGQRLDADSELTRLREIEHHAWHLLDDSAENMATGEISVTKDNFERLVKLLPDEHPGEAHSSPLGTLVDGGLKEQRGLHDNSLPKHRNQK